MVDLGQKRQVNSCLFYWDKLKFTKLKIFVCKAVLPQIINVLHRNIALQQVLW